ncbi:lipocalin-like domain-containing protein [Nitrosovibrio sp. Nv4]|uniref:lipocalin-like domain-containing protein n=1 Tax=Nitrosovibrio sp. Nv4 TaxID=1945880 RepID=UPI000BC8C5C9|nr:carotenoid 1,2-hydratase [Nitrosovibrio sp. Nv4]SOD41065.1 Predicted secreted hydrolase [Nitrosovibrio sp. Nv4]
MQPFKCNPAYVDHSNRQQHSVSRAARISFQRASFLAAFFIITWFGAAIGFAASPQLSPVIQGVPLAFPHDFGAHPDFRNEWWYATGWLETPEKKSLGFQVTFFRVATQHDRSNPSRFAPQQLIIAHAALSDPAAGKLLHDQKSAREGFGLAYTKEGNTNVKLNDWYFVREENGRYETSITADNFMLQLSLIPTQAPMLQDLNGFSRKGPRPEQASYYYSEPQLQVTGTVTRDGKEIAVNGIAWLDHEWSTAYLDPAAEGWDWVGANLDDGSSLMAFRIRSKDGSKVWAYAGIRDPSGRFTKFEPEQVTFEPQRNWRSPRTNATYPVEMRIRTGSTEWLLTPLQDDQELDSRQSTGSVYWEGAVTITRDGKPAGRGYYEMTGYVEPLTL